MSELKVAYQNGTDNKRKLAILTLSPFQKKRTVEVFGATPHLVKKARKLKEDHGILPDVQPMHKGHRIGGEDQSKVKAFYESDGVSRMCPGKKDCVSVGGAKVQKRLVLGNLRELYNLYKQDENNPKVGFSTFAALRPKNCVLAGSSGTHSVCVCTYHQNPALLISALDLPGLTCNDLLDYAVCAVRERNCKMQACAECPGEEGSWSF